ncbi:hypothetical protein [Geomicrobium sp. JCM 19039]|uniref:hypothetical protein n=1 Tax=Geomicrobium sp. JCM 19039 TaxID=1460636 RepID=UPI00045F2A2E|nr:hypothetical protein [Geomicrobium sp. JCM 19039]GAK10772.1 hypothetical protein JCM19039_411 [Geomicrobium sp. JCM 19039]
MDFIFSNHFIFIMIVFAAIACGMLIKNDVSKDKRQVVFGISMAPAILLYWNISSTSPSNFLMFILPLLLTIAYIITTTYHVYKMVKNG